jgi:exopolysaccharide biosynthesis polyprenyl glycosylphosphotransferase
MPFGRVTPVRLVQETSSTASLDAGISAGAPSHVRAPIRHRRRWLVRRSLVLVDMVSLSCAFVLSSALFADRIQLHDHVSRGMETLLFLATLPFWTIFARILNLYERDDGRADHSTADETMGIASLVTFGTWVVFVGSWATKLARPELDRVTSFWLFALVFVLSGRTVARTVVRRMPGYRQTAIVIGAGHVGQLVARKIQHHPEYGIDLIGFVDDNPRERRADVVGAPVLGTLSDLSEVVSSTGVDRVIVAFSEEPDESTMSMVRALRDNEVLVDVVPRLYELVGPRADIHMIEGMPLLTVPHTRLSGSSLKVKRALDLVGATILLILTSPLFLVAAIRIRRESEGPVFFRQTRLGANMQPFTALKFRTMVISASEQEHRDYIRETMSASATAGANGTYKLARANEVTRFGRLLRKTSLDELPQLINVLRGEMSLVGPRPCLEYETEFFQPHHFERFQVPQGITGHWQVSARARSTFGEALEMDVAYVRGWSLGLDMRLLLRTPFAILRQRKATS